MATISNEKVKGQIYLLPRDISSNVEIFELPHPSNDTSKDPLRLFVHNDQLYQLRTKQFSKDREYNRTNGLNKDKYHYTSDLKPYKSVFMINENDRTDGYVSESSLITYTEKYDLGFSLCGYYYRNSVVDSEKSCFSHPIADVKANPDTNFLTALDLQEKLGNVAHKNWAKIPTALFEGTLIKLSEIVEEGGDKYYKIKADIINSWLLNKLVKLKNNFPSSLPVPKSLPTEIAEHLKTIMCCNLLVSLIPQLAYHELICIDSSMLNIKEAFQAYENYKKETFEQEQEKEILIRAAMGTGLSDSKPNKLVTKKIVKPKITKTKVVKGKGAIDGFFKKQASIP